MAKNDVFRSKQQYSKYLLTEIQNNIKKTKKSRSKILYIKPITCYLVKKSEKPERCFKNKKFGWYVKHGRASPTRNGGVLCKKILYAITKIKTFVQHESIGASEWTNTKKGERTPPQTVIMLCIQHFYKRKNNNTMKMPFPYQKGNSWSIHDNRYWYL